MYLELKKKIMYTYRQIFNQKPYHLYKFYFKEVSWYLNPFVTLVVSDDDTKQ